MKKMKYLFTGLAILFTVQLSRAEEGMWIPLLLEKYNLEAMQEAGLRLSAEDIYSINQDCLKDALVIFGGGCTGELISGDGLLLTNHHCGYGAIQRHSSVENDYLTHGFWAMDRDEELPNQGLSVTFLRYMEDVTEAMGDGITEGMEASARESKLRDNQQALIDKATGDNHFSAVIRPFYYGNEYYMFVYERFTDIRLVGAPPESIGNFGADQDNWMWPRHTGDFSMFRVYANADNEPADYSPDNRPYQPRRHLEINAGGIEKGDFTMVMGYPGSTQQYLYSAEVRHMLESSLPLKIDLRTTRLDIMDKYMKQSDVIRIQYASKFRGVSNAWKKWQGIILGLTRNKAVDLKLAEEEAFRTWLAADGERQMKYGELLDDFSLLYGELEQYSVAMDLMTESIMAVELHRQLRRVQQMMGRGAPADQIRSAMDRFYKDYHPPLDEECYAAMMEAYSRQIPKAFKPAFLQEAEQDHQGDFSSFAREVYKKALLNQPDKFESFLSLYEKKPAAAQKKLDKDPLAKYLKEVMDIYRGSVIAEVSRIQRELDQNYKLYMAALREQSENVLYPDANFTMRLTYGKVNDYDPRDGVEYRHYTTLAGVMDKEREGFEDYAVPDKLRELFEANDFGPYGVDGTMPVCFTATNHTSGGNSGSPVMDADGRLIGINFDRNWEGTMSDVHYDPKLCRNISVDIRYVLFIIDKYAGAGYLLEEMDIHW